MTQVSFPSFLECKVGYFVEFLLHSSTVVVLLSWIKDQRKVFFSNSSKEFAKIIGHISNEVLNYQCNLIQQYDHYLT